MSRVAASAPMAAAAPGGVVDSIVPIPVALERFRADLDSVGALAGGAPSRDALVERFVRAVETMDTTAVNALDLSAAEFAWLYYPHTRYTTRPYEMEPALLWFVLGQNSEKGITRVFRRFGGQPLRFAGYQCANDPIQEGPNRLWEECRIDVRPDGAEGPLTRRLFGTILERDGQFKFVSYANEL